MPRSYAKRVYNREHISRPKMGQMTKAINATLRRQHTKSKFKLRKPK